MSRFTKFVQLQDHGQLGCLSRSLRDWVFAAQSCRGGCFYSKPGRNYAEVCALVVLNKISYVSIIQGLNIPWLLKPRVIGALEEGFLHVCECRSWSYAVFAEDVSRVCQALMGRGLSRDSRK